MPYYVKQMLSIIGVFAFIYFFIFTFFILLRNFYCYQPLVIGGSIPVSEYLPDTMTNVMFSTSESVGDSINNVSVLDAATNDANKATNATLSRFQYRGPTESPGALEMGVAFIVVQGIVAVYSGNAGPGFPVVDIYT